MADKFQNVAIKTNPASQWVVLVASGAALASLPRGIICTAAGNITVEDDMGVSMTLTAPPVNTPIYLRPYKVTAVTGTFYGLY